MIQIVSLKKLGFGVLFLFFIELALLFGLVIQAQYIASNGEERFNSKKCIARSLLLTDICLVTESRHTRHISQPEPISPFQDLPGFYDHFPSSTFLSPPIYFGRISK